MAAHGSDEVCERLLALDPRSAIGQFLLATSHQMLCAWDGQEERVASLAGLVQQGFLRIDEDGNPRSPFGAGFGGSSRGGAGPRPGSCASPTRHARRSARG